MTRLAHRLGIIAAFSGLAVTGVALALAQGTAPPPAAPGMMGQMPGMHRPMQQHTMPGAPAPAVAAQAPAVGAADARAAGAADARAAGAADARAAGAADAHRHGATPPAGAAQSPSTAAFIAANEVMHRDMAIAFTGDTDRDFAAGMIPHHEGAIAMARIQLAHGRDPGMRRMAEEVIRAQESEIATLRAFLARPR